MTEPRILAGTNTWSAAGAHMVPALDCNLNLCLTRESATGPACGQTTGPVCWRSFYIQGDHIMVRRLFAVSALLLFLFPLRAGEPVAQESLREWVQKNSSRHAVGLYIQGKKVGWLVAELKLGKHAGRDVAAEATELYILMKSDGEQTGMKLKSVTYYS